ncbi:MAG: patatin-like phospholipase family protein [Candidatus Woesearchaeota archaeon]
MKTALVLTGGGSKGAVEVGVLKVLSKCLIPDVFIGTSVGALNAAVFLDGKDFSENILNLERIWIGVSRKKIFPLNRRIFYKFHKIESLFSNRGLKRLVDENLKAESFKDLARPLYINCTNLSDGKSHYFYKGNLHDPIVASCAISPFFEPVMINNSYYIDGGHSNYLGLDKIKELKCDQVILVNLGYHKQSKDIKGILNMSYYVSEMMKRQLIMNSIMSFKIKKLIEISPLLPEHLHITDFSQTEKLIKIGVREADKALEKI